MAKSAVRGADCGGRRARKRSAGTSAVAGSGSDHLLSLPDPPLTGGRADAIAFPYFGGKYRHMDFIRRNLPGGRNHHFVDVFGGSAAVSMNVVDLYDVVTYNDYDEAIVNFFRCLRHDFDLLKPQIELTPYSRQEWRSMKDMSRQDNESDVDWARRFYCGIFMSYGNSIAKRGFRRTVSTNVGQCPHTTFRNSTERLVECIWRLKSMQFECLDWRMVLNDFETPETIFYCDPPYMPAVRSGSADSYRYEMSDDDHVRLADALNKVKCKAIISGYDSELYNALFADWERVADNAKVMHHGARFTPGNAPTRQEVIWRNYPLAEPIFEE